MTRGLEAAVKRLRLNASSVDTRCQVERRTRSSLTSRGFSTLTSRCFSTSLIRSSDKDTEPVQDTADAVDAAVNVNDSIADQDSTIASTKLRNFRSEPQPDSNSPVPSDTPRKRPSAGRTRRIKRYKPNISSSFIQSHFVPAADNPARLDTLDYGIPESILDETILCIRGGLFADSTRSRSSPIIESLSTKKRHILLDCPLEGSSQYLDQVVRAVAGEIGADLLTFDGQDIMELTEDIWHHSGVPLAKTSSEDVDGFSPSPFPYEQKTDLDRDIVQSNVGRVEIFEPSESEESEEGAVGAVAFDNSEDWQSNTEPYKRRNGLLRRLDSSASSSSSGKSSQEQSIMEKLVVFFSTLIDARPLRKVTATDALQSPSLDPCIIHFKDVSDFLESDRHLSYLLLSSLIASINHRHVTRPTILVASYTPSVIMSPISSAASAITKVTGRTSDSPPHPMKAFLDKIGMSPSVMRDQKTADQIASTKQEWDRSHVIDFMSELETGGIGDKSAVKQDDAASSSDSTNLKTLDFRLGLTNMSEIVMDGAKGNKNEAHRAYTLPPGIAILPDKPDAILDRLVRIGIPPPLWIKQDSKKAEVTSSHFEEMRKRQIVDINTRSLLRVIAKKGVIDTLIMDVNDDLSKYIDRFDNRIWSFERLNRLATLISGLYQQEIRKLQAEDVNVPEDTSHGVTTATYKSGRMKVNIDLIARAAEVLRVNAETRRAWAVERLRQLENASTYERSNSLIIERPITVNSVNSAESETETRPETKMKTSRVVLNKRDLDTHEAKLLNRVVDPEMLHTTFDNVQVTPDVIKTLRSVITLPLLYPRDFTYGVLQRHFISGVLLFGPPGTGKTLLAKAVAKESGARMIEIKASDVFDMYVGEGEKNVQAIFSLARKISPCVVFLDEVDALFGARRSDMHNQNHREIINQFMLEWDGLSSNNSGVLLMGATNRPFDLDDAILRRMPRRILIDLPSKEDRRAILSSHLADEKLADDVDLDSIADRTPLFSGSDLKNVCVSAALDAVRELVAALDSNQPTEMPHRVLHLRHFETALKEITPSCSEDMSSLTELRKWDGLYGDGGAARTRKWSGIGFEEITRPKINVR